MLYIRFYRSAAEEHDPDVASPVFGPFLSIDTWAGDLAGDTESEKIKLARRKNGRYGGYVLQKRVEVPDSFLGTTHQVDVKGPEGKWDYFEICDGKCGNRLCFAFTEVEKEFRKRVAERSATRGY